MNTCVGSQGRVHHRRLRPEEAEGRDALGGGEVHGAAVVRDDEVGAPEQRMERADGEGAAKVLEAACGDWACGTQDRSGPVPLCARSGDDDAGAVLTHEACSDFGESFDRPSTLRGEVSGVGVHDDEMAMTLLQHGIELELVLRKDFEGGELVGGHLGAVLSAGERAKVARHVPVAIERDGIRVEAAATGPWGGKTERARRATCEGGEGGEPGEELEVVDPVVSQPPELAEHEDQAGGQGALPGYSEVEAAHLVEDAQPLCEVAVSRQGQEVDGGVRVLLAQGTDSWSSELEAPQAPELDHKHRPHPGSSSPPEESEGAQEEANQWPQTAIDRLQSTHRRVISCGVLHRFAILTPRQQHSFVRIPTLVHS